MGDPAGPLLPALRAVVGGTHVLTAPHDVAPYLTDQRDRYHGAARAVVRPGNTDEVAAVVRCCSELAVPIVSQGGNTSLCGGATPHTEGGEIVLSMSRLDRIRGVDVDNAALTVEAGVPLARVQNAAREAGLLFPLSLASEGSCQIGGNLSTNAGGTAVLRYGNARDLVLGLEVVLADGRVWTNLKGLRKDNTGYDLKQLFIGSEGTLGIITAAVLKLFALPRSAVTAWVAVADVEQAVALLRALRAALGDRVTGFELVSRECVALVHARFPALQDPLPGHAWYALVQADDAAPDAPLMSQMETALADVVAQSIAVDAVLAQSKAQAAALWAIREHIPEAQRLEGPNIKHDISLAASRIGEFVQRAGAALDATLPGLRHFTFGHLGDGNLHYNLAAPPGEDARPFMDHAGAATRIVHDLVDELGGSFSAEHGIGQLKRDDMMRYKPAIDLEVMRAVKRALDPKDLLNPGKVV
jgi:FAD/FMN-containing dehydrogenase